MSDNLPSRSGDGGGVTPAGRPPAPRPSSPSPSPRPRPPASPSSGSTSSSGYSTRPTPSSGTGSGRPTTYFSGPSYSHVGHGEGTPAPRPAPRADGEWARAYLKVGHSEGPTPETVLIGRVFLVPARLLALLAALFLVCWHLLEIF